MQASPEGKYVYWYGRETKSYYAYDVSTGIQKYSEGITVPLYNTDNDVPDYPAAARHGWQGWPVFC